MGITIAEIERYLAKECQMTLMEAFKEDLSIDPKRVLRLSLHERGIQRLREAEITISWKGLNKDGDEHGVINHPMLNGIVYIVLVPASNGGFGCVCRTHFRSGYSIEHFTKEQADTLEKAMGCAGAAAKEMLIELSEFWYHNEKDLLVNIWHEQS